MEAAPAMQPPCSSTQAKLSAAEVAPAMEIKNISISPSGSSVDAPGRSAAASSEGEYDPQGQGEGKQPKRIQFKTLTLLKPK